MGLPNRVFPAVGDKAQKVPVVFVEHFAKCVQTVRLATGRRLRQAEHRLRRPGVANLVEVAFGARRLQIAGGVGDEFLKAVFEQDIMPDVVVGRAERLDSHVGPEQPPGTVDPPVDIGPG